MKKFKYAFTPVLWTILALIIIISLAGIVINVYNLFLPNVASILPNVIFIVLCVALIGLTVSIIFFSFYQVKQEKITFRLGFITNVYPLKNVIAITHFTATESLVIYFDDQTYTRIVISKKQYDDFTKTLRDFQPQIIVTESAEKDQEKNK